MPENAVIKPMWQLAVHLKTKKCMHCDGGKTFHTFFVKDH